MNDEILQDAALAVRCQIGEQDAWAALIDRWQPRLWRFVFRMLPDRVTAEDVLQTIWLRVVRSMVHLREPEAFAPWVYRIARLAVADQLRAQYRHPPLEQFVELADHDDEFEILDIADSLESGLGRLHPTDREAVVLFYFEQRPVREVAEICGVPPGTIKSRLHRARTIIRKALENEEQHAP